MLSDTLSLGTECTLMLREIATQKGWRLPEVDYLNKFFELRSIKEWCRLQISPGIHLARLVMQTKPKRRVHFPSSQATQTAFLHGLQSRTT